jgi:osmotically-inducible protein OsmY
MSLEEAAQRVAESAKRLEFQPTPSSEQALQDLTVKARVEAALAVKEETRSVILNILVRQGTVHAWGGLPGFGLEREVIRAIEGVEGVRDIVPDFRVVLEKVSVGDIH